MEKIQLKANVSGSLENGSLKLGFNLGDFDILLDVVKIEVTPNIHDAESDDEFIIHNRTIRFTTTDGQVLDVTCRAEERKSLELQEVDELSEREPQVDEDESVDWLRPKKYKE